MARSSIAARIALAVLAALVAFNAIALPRPAIVAAATPPVACALWASPTGSDAAAGSSTAPLRTIGALVSRLRAGETGCLRGGTYTEFLTISASNGVAGTPVTIASAPGETARVGGQIHFAGTSHDIVMSGITFIGNGAAKSTHLNVDGDRITLRGNDISHPLGICVDIGAINAYSQTYSGTTAEDVVLHGNRIHHCGTDPTISWSQTDSGAHGVYVIDTRNARITDNLIYANQWRGLQTWPKAEGTLIANNVFDGNATNVNIGSALTEGFPWKSVNTVVRDNIITNATLWRPDKNPAQVHGNFPADGQTHGNVVTGNCLFHADPTRHFSGNGYAASANVIGDPRYADRTAGDFRLPSGSPCAGKGPASIQPPATDTTPPETTITAGPGTFLGATTASLAFTASEASARFECRVDASPFTPCTSPWTTAALADGTHTAQVRAIDAAGNADATPATRTWTTDTVRPTATAPVQALVGPQLTKAADGTPRVPVRVTWSGADAGSGIATYEVQQTTDRGTTWQPVAVTAGATSSTRPLAVGAGYAYRVRAVDRAGNVGAWMTGPRVLVAAYQNDHAAVRYSGTWATHTHSAFMGGTARYASTAGSRATVTVSNVRNVALVSYVYATRGQARVYVDGALHSTIDLYSPTANVPQAVVTPLRWAASGQHTIAIEVVGTAGHPRVDVDAFLALHDQP